MRYLKTDWPTDQLTDKCDYYGPNQVNIRPNMRITNSYLNSNVIDNYSSTSATEVHRCQGFILKRKTKFYYNILQCIVWTSHHLDNLIYINKKQNQQNGGFDHSLRSKWKNTSTLHAKLLRSFWIKFWKRSFHRFINSKVICSLPQWKPKTR